MENNSSELLQDEQQTNPQEEQYSQGQENLQDEQVQPEEQKGMEKPTKESVFGFTFEKFSGAVCGICSIFVALGIIISIAWGGFALCESVYDRWLSKLDGFKIGQKGLVYVMSENAIMKECFNKKVLKDVTDFVRINESIGIVCYQGKDGVIDLNTTKFLIPAQYDKIWTTGKDTIMAATADTVYTITMPSGNVVMREPTTCFYRCIRPIYRNCEDCVLFDISDEENILLYEYTDYAGKCGMMSKDMKKLTPAIYSCVDVVEGKDDVFYCTFGRELEYEDDMELGELRNIKGEKIQ